MCHSVLYNTYLLLQKLFFYMQETFEEFSLLFLFTYSLVIYIIYIYKDKLESIVNIKWKPTYILYVQSGHILVHHCIKEPSRKAP